LEGRELEELKPLRSFLVLRLEARLRRSGALRPLRRQSFDCGIVAVGRLGTPAAGR
jgi:hypothetical protein